MINLLPPDLQQQYVYGRKNTQLRRWMIALVMGIAGVTILTFGGLFLMEEAIVQHRAQVSSSQSYLKEQKLEETSQQAKETTASIKLAVDVLSKEILFSELLTQIAKVTPARTSLTDLTISKEQNAIEIKALAANYTSATQLQINLADPANKIFKKADIQAISCAGEAKDGYQCSVTIKALFNENNPFLYINKGKKQ